MALTRCEECGQTVSLNAVTCPHCGAPVKKSSPAKRSGDNVSGLTVILILTMGGCLGTLVVLIVYIGVCLLAGYLINEAVSSIF